MKKSFQLLTPEDKIFTQQLLITEKNLKQLKNDGYTVIRSLVGDHDLDTCISSFNKYLSEQQNLIQYNNNFEIISENNPSGVETLVPRYHPLISKVFSYLWKSDDPHKDMISGQYAVNYDIPSTNVSIPFTCINDVKNLTGVCSNAYIPQGYSWRISQKPNNSEIDFIEGSVNLYPISCAATGSMIVIKGSHKLHSEIIKQAKYSNPQSKKSNNNSSNGNSNNNNNNNSNVEISENFHTYIDIDETALFYQSSNLNMEIVSLSGIQAGSLILWDSRLTHCHSKNVTSGSYRCINIHVCHVPRKSMDNVELETSRKFTLYGSLGNPCPRKQQSFQNIENCNLFAMDNPAYLNMIAQRLTTRLDALQTIDNNNLLLFYGLIRMSGFQTREQFFTYLDDVTQNIKNKILEIKNQRNQ